MILTRDLSVMNGNLVAGSQGLVVGKLANYTLKVAFPQVTVGVNWKDIDIVPGQEGNAYVGGPASRDPQTAHDGRRIALADGRREQPPDDRNHLEQGAYFVVCRRVMPPGWQEQFPISLSVSQEASEQYCAHQPRSPPPFDVGPSVPDVDRGPRFRTQQCQRGPEDLGRRLGPGVLRR